MLALQLLGQTKIHVDSAEIALRGKMLAFIGCLALEENGVARHIIAQRLWSDNAGQSLRQAMYRCKHIPELSDFLEDQELVVLRCSTDVQTLTSLEPIAALALLRLPLLPDLDSHFSEIGLEWLTIQREKLAQQRMDLLLQVAAELEGSDAGAALKYLQELQSIDPSNETTTRHLIRVASNQGNQTAALNAFETLRKTLHQQFGTAPSAAMLEVIEQIRGISKPQISVENLRLLRALAIYGQAFHAKIFAAILETPVLALTERVGLLEEQGILVAGWFADAILQQRIQTETPISVARLLHQRFAEYLEPQEPVMAAKHWLKTEQFYRAAQLFLQNPDSLEAGFQALWVVDDDETRGLALAQIGRISEARSDLVLLAAVCDQLESLARHSQSDKIIYNYLIRRASLYMRSGKPIEAIPLLEDALLASVRLQDPVLRTQSEVSLGAVNLSLRQFVTAREYFEKAAQSTDLSVQLRAIGNLGTLEAMQGHLEAALLYSEKALGVARAIGQLPVIGSLLTNIAATATQLGKLERAEQGFRESLEVSQRIQNIDGQRAAYRNLGFIALQRGYLGAAWNTTQESLELAQDDLTQQQTLTLLADIALHCKNYVVAEQYLSQATALTSTPIQQKALEFSKAILTLASGQDSAETTALTCLEQLSGIQQIAARLELARYAKQISTLEQCRIEAGQNRSYQLQMQLLELRLAKLQKRRFDTSQLLVLLEDEPRLDSLRAWQLLSKTKSDTFAARASTALTLQAEGLPKILRQTLL